MKSLNYSTAMAREYRKVDISSCRDFFCGTIGSEFSSSKDLFLPRMTEKDSAGVVVETKSDHFNSRGIGEVKKFES
jgi:hypothetical protein